MSQNSTNKSAQEWARTHVLDLPGILLSNCSYLPELRGVYLVCHNSKVLYVGMTSQRNFRTRWHNHEKKSLFLAYQSKVKEGLHIRYIDLDEASALHIGAVEMELITAYQPHFNSVGSKPFDNSEEDMNRLKELIDNAVAQEVGKLINTTEAIYPRLYNQFETSFINSYSADIGKTIGELTVIIDALSKKVFSLDAAVKTLIVSEEELDSSFETAIEQIKKRLEIL